MLGGLIFAYYSKTRNILKNFVVIWKNGLIVLTKIL